MKPRPYNRSKRYLLELSRSQLLVGITGLLIILCFVFLLGIFVGQGYVSETITQALKEKIYKLEAEKQELIQKYLATQKTGIPKEEVVEPKYDFYRDLAGKETPPHQEIAPKPTPPPPVSPPPADLPVPAPPPGEMKAQAKDSIPASPTGPLKTEAPPGKPQTARKAEAQEPKVSKPKGGSEATALVVQVGSYRDEATAQGVAKRLTAKGYPARVRSKDLPEKGGKWYRVQIGPYSNRFEAERAVIRLEHDGFQGVVVENH
jgi:cell division protein FtsN